MTQVMTPSMTTDGQITKAVSNYRAMLEKHAPQFEATVVQQVLGDPELAAEQLAVFRKRVEMTSSIIVRRAKVDRSRTPQAVLDATGRKQYTDREVVNAMPRGEGEEVDVHFFKLDRWVSDDDLENEYAKRGLKPADPYSLAAVNESDPAFADEYPNGTHWKDAQCRRCFMTFFRWNGGRSVRVSRNVDGWDGYWFFAGLRK